MRQVAHIRNTLAGHTLAGLELWFNSESQRTIRVGWLTLSVLQHSSAHPDPSGRAEWRARPDGDRRTIFDSHHDGNSLAHSNPAVACMAMVPSGVKAHTSADFPSAPCRPTSVNGAVSNNGARARISKLVMRLPGV